MKSRRRWLRRLAAATAALLFLCSLTAAGSALYNQSLPTRSVAPDRLAEAEKARLAEIFHLRTTLGDAVWPGWGSADLPVVVYNEGYAFLVGYPEPPAGWRSVPDLRPHGGPWELVAGDSFQNEAYYRQPLPPDGATPQGFTVLVGERWAGSMQTWEWMQISFRDELRNSMPPPLAPFAPYSVLLDLFIDGSDMYLTLVAHELFHAFQGSQAAGRLAAAEGSLAAERAYPWDNAALQADWRVELELLVAALEATEPAVTADLARQFLAQRSQRRASAGLSAEAVNFEQQREWLEGLGRYAELEIWRLAADDAYTPVDAMQTVDDFAAYEAYARRWLRELDQIPRMATADGEGRFYYTGMAQAVLLDRLSPGWKAQALSPDAALEALLAQAVAAR